MKKLIAAWLLPLFLAACGGDAPLRVKDDKNELELSLEKLVPELMTRDKIAGLSFAVIRNGKTEFFQSYGTADVKKRAEVSEDTVFEAASLGKPVFAYLVLQLVQQGLLDLDVPIIKYAPDQLPAKTGGWEKVTGRMLLSHTAGAATYSDENSITLAFEPGKKFKYSGIGYDVMQAVVEHVTKNKLKDLANFYVFGPLKMDATSYIWQDGYKPFFAKGYDKDAKELEQKQKPEKGSASWSLYTTTKDYAKFVEAMLKLLADEKGAYGGMITPHQHFSDGVSWAVGWGLQLTDPNLSFWHWGSNPGYRSYVVGYPKEKIAIVLMSNSDNLFKAVDEIIKAGIGGSLPSYHWF